MKKYLFIFLSIFSIFFLYDNVNALTFEKCNQNVELDDTNYQYYFYFKNDTLYDNKFLIYKDNNIYYLVESSYSDNFVVSSSYDISFSGIRNNPVKKCYITSNGSLSCSNINTSTNFFSTGSTFSTDNSYSNVFSNSFKRNTGYSIVNNSNLTKEDVVNWFSDCDYQNVVYYLNNEVYQSFTIPTGSSHTLLYYEPSIEYEFSGWTYDSNIDLTNITSNVNIYGTTTLKPYYNITYYLNEEVYNTISVMKGTNYVLQDYTPPKYYIFSGWSYDSNIDLTNITSNVNIYGTTEYVRPNIEYTEETDSIIHNITLKIVGEGVPQEFDFVYQIFDFLVLLVLVLTVLSPFILLFKLLGVI